MATARRYDIEKLKKEIDISIKIYLLRQNATDAVADKLSKLYAHYIMTLGEEDLNKEDREKLITTTRINFNIHGFEMNNTLLTIAESVMKRYL